MDDTGDIAAAIDKKRTGNEKRSVNMRKGGAKRGRKARRKQDSKRHCKSDHDFGIITDGAPSRPRDNLILHLRVNPKITKNSDRPVHQATERDLLQYTPDIREPSPYEHSMSESFPCPITQPAKGNSGCASEDEVKNALSDR